MKTSRIEALANRGGLATADINIGAELRYNVIPAFLEDVGEASWRRKYATISVTSGDREYDLPNDFYWMKKVFDPGVTGASFLTNSEPPEMKYIGEDAVLVAQAEFATTPGTPSGYYIVQRGTAGSEVWKAIKFDRIPTAAFTLLFIYLTCPTFTNESADAELNPFIPEPLQWGFVEGLRAEIYLDRYGEGDARTTAALQKRQAWLDRARGRVELGQRNFAVFMD